MKRYLFVLMILAAAILCCACTDSAAEVYTATGEEWIIGFGSSEIALPEDTDAPLYMGGYSTGAEPEGILDLQRASAVWLSTRKTDGILLIGVDCVGLGSDTVADIRTALSDFAKETGCAKIAVYATHTHAGIDTLGLWGPVAQNGKNAAFMEQLVNAAVTAAKAAYDSRTSGTLYFGQTETSGMQSDSRDPQVYDSTMYQLRFSPTETDRSGVRLIFFSAHAESLRGDNRLISRDFPGAMADSVRAACGDDMLFIPGAIGGLIMTPVLLDPAEAETNPDFYADNCLETGKQLAEYALSITEETAVSPSLSYADTNCEIPLDNTLFYYYKFLGILGNPIKRGSDSMTGYALITQCAAMQLGEDITVALLPGEVFPELIYESYTAANADHTLSAETLPSLSAIAAKHGVKNLLIGGLCNDELGYILPPDNYLIHETLPYFDGITDASGENHYEETMSAGIRTAQCLFDAMEDVFAALAEIHAAPIS